MHVLGETRLGQEVDLAVGKPGSDSLLEQSDDIHPTGQPDDCYRSLQNEHIFMS